MVVVDKDIDRFATKLLEGWLPAEDESHGKKDGEAVKAKKGSSGRRRVVGGTSITAAAAADSSADEGGVAAHSLVAEVARARAACKMSYLVGAAPVVYGLPSV